MLDRTRGTITMGDHEWLKDDPDHVDGRRWIPLLVAEIERLRELLKDLRTDARRSDLVEEGARSDDPAVADMVSGGEGGGRRAPAGSISPTERQRCAGRERPPGSLPRSPLRLEALSLARQHGRGLSGSSRPPGHLLLAAPPLPRSSSQPRTMSGVLRSRARAAILTSTKEENHEKDRPGGVHESRHRRRCG
jgi:hypothetical protein